jgi:hypothetical protein
MIDCNTPSDDPTALVTSPAQALECAEALLNNASARPGGDSLWAAAAVAPLASLLYAASPRGNSNGVGWLVAAAGSAQDGLSAIALGWHSAMPYLADQPLLGNALQRALKCHPRQRDSLVMTICDALSPWMGSERDYGGE